VIAELIPTPEGMNLKIRYTVKGFEFMEIVDANSYRIAPYTFFTHLRHLQ
jgi:hypothetical protein